MKRGPAKYKCIGYISISPIRSGLLYPVFHSIGVNVSFVQEVGRSGEITSFIPFYDNESFNFTPSLLEIELSVGDISIYAFLDDQKIVELDYDEIGRQVRVSNNAFVGEHLPKLTRLSLLRLGKAPETSQLEAFREFVKGALPTESSRKIATAAHRKSSYEHDQWWDRIELGEQEQEQEGLPTSNGFLDLESEDLFEWLHEHSYDQTWTLALRTLMGRIVYDERIFGLLFRLLTADGFQLESATPRERNIVARGLELYTALDTVEDDFAELMYESIVDGSIFSLCKSVPSSIIMSFISKLEASDKFDVLPVDIYLDQLRSDFISRELAYDLIRYILDSNYLGLRYPEKSFYAGSTRLDVFKAVLGGSGRLGLVVDERTRRNILRMSNFD